MFSNLIKISNTINWLQFLSAVFVLESNQFVNSD